MGLIITLAKKDYLPGGDSSKRKYAPLNKCLLGHYISEWKEISADEKQIGSVPTSLIDLVLADEIMDSLYAQRCKDQFLRSNSGPNPAMTEFNDGLGKLITHALILKGMTEDIIDKAMQALEIQK